MTRPPPTSLASPSAQAQCEQALTLLIADGAAANGLVQAVLASPGLAGPWRALAQAVRALYELREGSTAQGLLALEAGEREAASAPSDARAADWLRQARSQWLRREGRLPEALALLQGLHARAEQRLPIDACFSAAALGTVQSMLGDQDAALDAYCQALSLARRSGVPSLVVNALNNLGSFQADLYNLEDAEPLLTECLTGALQLGSRRQTIYAAGNLTQCLCMMGRPTEALQIAREHLIARIAPQDPPALQRDEEIAQVLLDNGLVDEAAEVLGREAHVDPLSNEQATVRVWLEARLRLLQGRPGEALRLCLARQRLLEQDGDDGTVVIDRVNLLRLAAQAAQQVGDPASAYALLAQAFAKHEQLLGRAARSRQLSLQISHRLRQTEWERDAARQMAQHLEALNDSLQAQVRENERLQQRLRVQALEDPLTGLYNRRHLLDAGAALLKGLRRRDEGLALAIIDLDHFKRVNDLHGHDGGDRVLRGFADLLRRHTRAEDLVCRYGGEEFVLLLPGAHARQAHGRLEQLLALFQAMSFRAATGDSFQCTFSAGLAVSSSAGEDLPALLARADAALYAAKSAGRARVVSAGAPAPGLSAPAPAD